MEVCIDEEWEYYIGMLYSYIIKQININPSIIVEACPGFKTKMAYALKDINFKGTLYLFDTNDDVLLFIKEKYKELLPQTNIICVKDKIQNINHYIKNADLFLSNHPLDDMILQQYMENNFLEINKTNDIFDYWKEIEKNYNYIIQKVENDFINLFKQNIQYFIISQYKSNVFLKDDNIHTISNLCMKKIKKYIKNYNLDLKEVHPYGNDERYLLKNLMNNVQNIDNWIIGEYNEKNKL